MLTINGPKDHQPEALGRRFSFSWRGHVGITIAFGFPTCSTKKALLRLIQTEVGRLNVEVPHRPSGIGFLRDGSPIVASMQDRKIMRLVDAEAVGFTSTSASLPSGDLNDMLVDDDRSDLRGQFRL